MDENGLGVSERHANIEQARLRQSLPAVQSELDRPDFAGSWSATVDRASRLV